MIKLLKFYSDTCAPCKAMAPIVKDVTDHAGIELVEFNISTDKGINMARSMGVRQVPTFIITKDGEPKKISVGSMSEDDFVNFVESV